MTQQEVAALALPYMEKDNSRCLDMEHWASEDIEPHEDPFACGTSLCAAGWVAHLLGYVVRPSGYIVVGETRHVEKIAQEALELTDVQANFLFMVADAGTALRCFSEMADGLGFPDAVIMEWRNGRLATV